MRRWLARWRLLLLLVLLSGCGGDPATGPGPVAWDRDTCERCNMAIGDRRFAAQVRGGADHRVHRFDDLGCALLWIDEEKEEPEEIWVRDLDGASWLAAEEAHYVPVDTTPMDYGFGA